MPQPFQFLRQRSDQHGSFQSFAQAAVGSPDRAVFPKTRQISCWSVAKRYDHEAVDVRDSGMGGAADSDIAAYAQQNRLALVTRDFDFADIRKYPPAQRSPIRGE
ncbi:MAG: DUF5615 family PIN-like protein [Chthoniobacterales bacterium]